MLKGYLLLLFLAFLLHVKGMKAHAESLYVDHDRFLSLSEIEKEELIVKTMEFMVELESQYERAVLTKGFNPERLKKYTQIINRLQSFLISSAHASNKKEMPKWTEYGDNFNKFLTDKKGEKCFYAGWPSRYIKTSIGKRCVHPALLDHPSLRQNPVPPEHKDYLRSSSTCNHNKDKITCNPAIFGFKKAADRSLFCVNAGEKNQENAAFNCMQEALKEKGDATTDDFEVRMKSMKDQLSSNPTILENVQKFTYKTCICPTENKSVIETQYTKAVQRHQTCYGLMKAIGEFSSQCTVSNQVDLKPYEDIKNELNLDIKKALPQMKSFKTEAEYKAAVKKYYSEYKEYYGKFLDKPKTNDPICNPQITPSPAKIEEVVPKCVATCSQVIPPQKPTCTFKVNGEDVKAPTPDEIKNEMEIDYEGKPIRCKLNGLPIPEITPPAQVETPPKPAPAGPVITSEKVATKEDSYPTPPVPEPFDLPPDEPVAVTPAPTPTKPVVEKPATVDEPSCKIEFTAAEEKQSITAKVTLKGLTGQATYTWTPTPKVASTTDSATFEPTAFPYQVNVEAKVSDKTAKCSSEYKLENPKYELTVTKEDTTPSAIKIKFIAKINGKQEEVDGYYVAWEREEADGLDLPNPDSDSKKTPGAAEEGEEELAIPEVPVTSASSATATTPAPAADPELKEKDILIGFEIEETRSTKPYKICAKLMKDGKGKDKKCETVNKKDASKSPTNSAPHGAQRPNYPAGGGGGINLRPPMPSNAGNADHTTFGIK